jgi:diphosphomevalonate decarboxylase
MSHSGKIAWRSPSNIAIIKYWGKHGIQLPRNPSISFTLQNAATDMHLHYQKKEKADGRISLDFDFVEKDKIAKFRQKMVAFLETHLALFPFLTGYDLYIHSTNSFPHSAGIASSASSMSAFALCLCSMEQAVLGRNTLQGTPLSREEGQMSCLKPRERAAFFQKASHIARLASGSACRSVYPIMAVWGKCKEVKGSSDVHAVGFDSEVHPIFKTYHDDILIAHTGEKSVSSRMGHGLMDGNPFAKPRYQQARERLTTLIAALKAGDVETFGQIAEDEAMTLHALMMTTSPWFTLLKPNTVKMIEILRGWREATKIPAYFSLDAGPNLHLLYPDAYALEVKTFIAQALKEHCENGLVIEDVVGLGASEITPMSIF